MTVQNALNSRLSNVNPEQLREIYSRINNHFVMKGSSAKDINKIIGIKSDSTTEGRIGLVVRS